MATKTKTDMRERIFKILFPYAVPKPSEMVEEIIQECMRELSGRFNSYLDERIADCSIPPLSKNHARILAERKETLNWVKQNLARIVKEVQDENN